jgi:hypothetical protein
MSRWPGEIRRLLSLAVASFAAGAPSRWRVGVTAVFRDRKADSEGESAAGKPSVVKDVSEACAGARYARIDPGREERVSIDPVAATPDAARRPEHPHTTDRLLSGCSYVDAVSVEEACDCVDVQWFCEEEPLSAVAFFVLELFELGVFFDALSECF